MSNLLRRAGVAFLTFIIGVLSASLWIAGHRRPVHTIQSMSMHAVDQARSVAPDGWQRINVDDKFSFYLPPDMREAEPIGDYCGPAKDFRNKRLWLNYGYCETGSCDPSPALKGSSSFQSSQVEVGRRKALLTSWQEDRRSNWRFMTLCFQDIGDGKTWLSFGALSQDPQSLEVAKQVFASIEFSKSGD